MARFELKLPKMGESVAEATITSWLKEVGDTIELDEAIVEIATDKVDSEVPSEVEGTLVEVLFQIDDVVAVGETIAIIEIEGEDAESVNTKIKSTSDNSQVIEVEKIIEKAKKVVATPGTKIYGRLSIMTQVYFTVKKLFDISPNVFIPKPKVDSAYIRLVPKDYIFNSLEHEKKFKGIVNTVFSARRKMIKTSLKGIIDSQVLQELSIEPSSRPEILSIQNYIDISKNV